MLMENDDEQLDMMPIEKERCRNNLVSSRQFISFVPDSMPVPAAVSFQPGFSRLESSPNHFQCQFSFPCTSPINSLRRPQMLNDYAPNASYVLQDSCTYNGLDPHFSPHFNLSSIVPPSIQQDNNFINMRNEYNDSVFMAPSSQFAPATIPGFAFSVNFPLPRPDSTLEIMQSINLKNSPTLSSCREFGRCEVSGHQIFSQSQNLINQRSSHEEIVIVMQKELTKSDVGSIGRIVIPKDAEANFPPLFEREGIMLRMDDMAVPFTWEFKYRFWPNNKSRMYILENTGEFVKKHGLQAGDYLSIHINPASATYFVKGEKRSKLPEQDICLKS
ncbi:putative B3 domain-containing protein [Carex littledalei]|uniref:Putative B3 domain-containing protein n=1 Tax=Carex littledalei TaxID=544730 RepID=A0A833R9A9_9POAL|nr:putative B3 domain-containing protein [Carex littledalei]